MAPKEVKSQRIRRGGAVRWVVLGAAALFGVLLLAGCNVATAQNPSADELAQQRQKNSDLQKQIEELEDEQDERNEADLQRQIDDLQKQQDNQQEQQAEAKQPQQKDAKSEGGSSSVAPSASASAPASASASASASAAPSNSGEVTEVRTASESYYAMVEAQDWSYTYDHLASATQSTYTPDEWATTNQSLAGDGSITYTVGSITVDSPGAYAVDVQLSNGDARTTYFVLEDGQWLHSFSDDEYALFGTSVVSSPSASASASASASTDAPSGGGDAIKVVVSANTPVDVSIISAEDLDAPMISEQIQSKTYEFALQPGADLAVSASDPETDFAASDDISVEVYKNGQLQAEDSDGFMALVQF